MKPSEILRAVLPIYKENSSIYMCCLCRNEYASDGIPNGLEQPNSPEVYETVREIESAILGRYTLNGYLRDTNDHYNQLVMVDIDANKSAEPHAIRIRWYENFILELEGRNL